MWELRSLIYLFVAIVVSAILFTTTSVVSSRFSEVPGIYRLDSNVPRRVVFVCDDAAGGGYADTIRRIAETFAINVIVVDGGSSEKPPAAEEVTAAYFGPFGELGTIESSAAQCLESVGHLKQMQELVDMRRDGARHAYLSYGSLRGDDQSQIVSVLGWCLSDDSDFCRKANAPLALGVRSAVCFEQSICD